MTSVTTLLGDASGGNADALNKLYERVYAELRAIAAHKMASERNGHTLQPTALDHEAYLRIEASKEIKFANRAHFFAATAEVMLRAGSKALDHPHSWHNQVVAIPCRADKTGGKMKSTSLTEIKRNERLAYGNQKKWITTVRQRSC